MSTRRSTRTLVRVFHLIHFPTSSIVLTGVPSLKDDDFVIWESNAINKYLVDKYDGSLNLSFPKGSKESYLVDQWLDFHGSGQVCLW